MKKIYVTVILLLSFFSMINAQEGDSTSNISVRNRSFAADSADRYIYEFAKKRPYLAATFIPVNYNIITIGHRFFDGNYIPAQSATRIQQTYLHTEGRTMLKDVSLYGAFNYQNTTEDSTKWAQQSRNNTSSPYYYGSPAKISYNRSVYTISGVAQRNMINDNLPVALGVDYRIGDHYGTNDPRGAVSDFQFNLFGSIGYRINTALQGGFAVKYGYGQERVRVDYKNKQYFESSVFPDYTNYVVNGYGEPIPKNNNRSFENDQDRAGIETYILFNDDKFGDLILNIAYSEEEQLFNYKSTDSDLIKSHNEYILNTLNLDLIWKKTLNNKNIILGFNYANTDGSDYNFTILSNNYLYNSNSVAIKTVLTIKGKTNYNYHLEFAKQGEERQDGLSGNLVNYNNLKIKGGAGFVKRIKQQSWGINLSGIYSLPLNNEFIIPVGNEKIFTRGVIYHDYLFNTASYAGGILTADYNFPGYKNIQTGIRMGFNYIENLYMENLNRTLTSVPGNHRLSANLSLNLYF